MAKRHYYSVILDYVYFSAVLNFILVLLKEKSTTKNNK